MRQDGRPCVRLGTPSSGVGEWEGGQWEGTVVEQPPPLTLGDAAQLKKRKCFRGQPSYENETQRYQ